jgi:hypothetical protein
MNTLHTPKAAAPISASSAASHIAGRTLRAFRDGITEPALSPRNTLQTLRHDLLRFCLQGAALGMVVGLSVVLINRIAQAL